MQRNGTKMSISEAHAEVKDGLGSILQPGQAVDSLDYKPLGYRLDTSIARLCFRGIYCPMMGRFAWIKVISPNRHTIFTLMKEAFSGCCGAPLRSVSSLSSRVGDNALRHDYHDNSPSDS